MEIAEMAIMRRSTLRRPRASDIQPDRIRPEALPAAPMTRPMTGRAAPGIPSLLANGMSWLMTMRPAAQPRQYAIHMKYAAGVFHISPGVNSYVVASDF